MNRLIIVNDEARLDVIDTACYIAEDSLEASNRFVEAVDAAFKRLAELPGIGASREYSTLSSQACVCGQFQASRAI